MDFLKKIEGDKKTPKGLFWNRKIYILEEDRINKPKPI